MKRLSGKRIDSEIYNNESGKFVLWTSDGIMTMDAGSGSTNEEESRFPGVPELLQDRGIENTVCMQQDYLPQLTHFIQKMRAK